MPPVGRGLLTASKQAVTPHQLQRRLLHYVQVSRRWHPHFPDYYHELDSITTTEPFIRITLAILIDELPPIASKAPLPSTFIIIIVAVDLAFLAYVKRLLPDP